MPVVVVQGIVRTKRPYFILVEFRDRQVPDSGLSFARSGDASIRENSDGSGEDALRVQCMDVWQAFRHLPILSQTKREGLDLIIICEECKTEVLVRRNEARNTGKTRIHADPIECVVQLRTKYIVLQSWFTAFPSGTACKGEYRTARGDGHGVCGGYEVGSELRTCIRDTPRERRC